MLEHLATHKKLADFIKEKRREKDLSARQLSIKAGYANSTVARIENQTSNPSFHAVVNIFAALEVDFHDFDLFLKLRYNYERN